MIVSCEGVLCEGSLMGYVLSNFKVKLSISWREIYVNIPLSRFNGGILMGLKYLCVILLKAVLALDKVIFLSV